MKKITLLLLLTAPWLITTAQYKPIDKTSTVKFVIKNFGIAVNGKFSGLEGNISYDPAQPEKAAFAVSIDAATVYTGNETRDGHLKKDNYFDVEHFPRIRFESTKVTANGKSPGLMLYGKLTIKNHTKEMAVPFTAEPTPEGYVFKASFAVNRKDFAVGGTSIISDTAELTLEVFTGK